MFECSRETKMKPLRMEMAGLLSLASSHSLADSGNFDCESGGMSQRRGQVPSQRCK